MANSMNLPIPVVGVDTGPNWANAINNCMALIAEHTHASGSGVQITPTGLNINAPLLFNGNPLQSAAYLNILPQGVTVPTPINGSLYINGVDLFFRDGAGNNITITQGGNVLAGSTGIISGTATASFVGSVFTVLQAPGIRAHVDASSYVFKYNGSYQSPPANSVVLQAPSSVPGSFALTLPPGLPGINNAIMASNTVGQLTFITSDTVATGMTAAGANAIGQLMTSAGANPIGQAMTSVGANSIAAAMNATGADTIAATMTATGANAIGLEMTTAAVNLQSGGKYAVVSSVNAASQLAIVRGNIAGGGGITAGEGFTVNFLGGGAMIINFSVAFASTPSVTTSCQDNNTWCAAFNITTSQVQFFTFKNGVGSSPQAFSFIAIGPR